jgi:phosphoenolpyruvate synthase/pyruvate phosphate dikinase
MQARSGTTAPESGASYVRRLDELDRTQVALAGGKGAQLGELSRVEGVRVPAGFCVTTDAFARVMAQTPRLAEMLDRLSQLDADDRDGIATLSAEIHAAIEAAAIPDDIAAAIASAVAELGENTACAVRSSATAEDLPAASFAGQHDTFLNVVGPAQILRHVSRCWASLFAERAVVYRVRNGFDHRKVRMAVVVQRLIDPQVSGILFTAYPATSNRKITSVEASFGLGEALVSGRVNADVFKVRDGEIVDRTPGVKRLAMHAMAGGGIQEESVAPAQQERAALTDAQVLWLERLGRRIEAHFGAPQDIEWCLAGDDLYIVQSRPITALFPIPLAPDAENHVYISVGHQQMMTDAMRPLGLSMWQLIALRPMSAAGGRLFVDVTRELASPAIRARMVEGFASSDPLIGDALRTILARDFVPTAEDAGSVAVPPGLAAPGAKPAPIENDPAIVADLVARNEVSVAQLKRDIAAKSGPELLDFILDDIQEMKRLLLDPESVQAIMAGMEATAWLNAHLGEWLGEKNAADILSQSVPYNVTSEMGLALLDVADVIRPHADVVAFLCEATDESFLDELAALEGGAEARDAILAYLDTYGMRCVGEIDITRPRWSECPTALLPMLLSDIENFSAGEGQRRFEQGRQQALAKEREFLERVRELPDGEAKATEAKYMIDRIGVFVGYREYPKYGIVSRCFVYKQALLAEAQRLVARGAIAEKHDIFYLAFQELQSVVRTGHADGELIRQRKETFRADQARKPPRVLTSDGEAVAGSYHRGELPPGALAGLSVSAGTVEGRARVISDMAQADLEPGDILVTTHTDPSWSPLFVMAAGLVTEVGGLMTHGAVIAREYGLPAVVGVENATELIEDGQRIRVNGTDGYVEILPAT